MAGSSGSARRSGSRRRRCTRGDPWASPSSRPRSGSCAATGRSEPDLALMLACHNGWLASGPHPQKEAHVHAVLQAAEEAHRELSIPPIGFGIVSLAILLGLLVVTFAFRNIGARN